MHARVGVAVAVLVAFAAPGRAEPLVEQGDLAYQGSFRVPPDRLGAGQQVGFAYGGSALAYYPENDSLFIVGHVYDQMTAEIGIPAVVASTNLLLVLGLGAVAAGCARRRRVPRSIAR